MWLSSGEAPNRFCGQRITLGSIPQYPDGVWPLMQYQVSVFAVRVLQDAANT